MDCARGAGKEEFGMAQRKVIWTRTADLQLVGILEYWISRNKSATYSKKLLRLVVKKTQQIAKTPEIFPLSDFPETRVAPLDHFSILYKVDVDQVVITAFWDNRQDPKKLLEILRNQKTN
jgi:plasmid stabilization system protein ParE